MTWIIGASTLFGYGVVMSDVRVTCTRTGSTFDGLQKARILGPYIVGGFSGDVQAGLAMLDDFESLIKERAPRRDECCLPEWFADEWSPRAKILYERKYQERSVHLITVGVKPAVDTLGGALACVSVYRSPDFFPETSTGGNIARSIGSGSDVVRYRESLEYMFSTENLEYLKMEIGSPGGFARVVGLMLNRDMQMHPNDSVSSHLQVFIIKMGEVEVLETQGMPLLAHTWDELIDRINGKLGSEALLASPFQGI